jgi:hypothetical protein
MKRFLALFLLPAFMILTSASIWEGAASVSAGGDLPDDGYYAATNSFPRNTLVDITNLETGKTVRVIVASGLDSPGLLAMISREAAEAIGLQNRSIGRIRMTKPPDPIAFSRPDGDQSRSGDPDHDSQAAVSSVYPPPKAPPERPAAAPPPDESKSAGDTVKKDTGSPKESGAKPENPQTAGAERASEESAWILPGEEERAPPVNLPESNPGFDPAYDYTYSLIPADERPPEGTLYPEHSYFIDPLPSGPPSRPDPAPVETPTAPPANIPSPFSVPALSRLEVGKYYLQIGAYSRVELVEREITRIEKMYPLAVETTGSVREPVYRILVGPVNHGESGALIQYFRTLGYKDAFIRKGK